jgi:methylated-DNA-protein-cysteine methyltransferase-like protein
VARDRTDAGAPRPLEEAVIEVLLALEPGDVVTYGEVATEAGYPGRARAVGRILATTEVEVAWWRVVTAAGRLVPGHEDEHARRLEAEGAAVDRERGRVVGPATRRVQAG